MAWITRDDLLDEGFNGGAGGYPTGAGRRARRLHGFNERGAASGGLKLKLRVLMPGGNRGIPTRVPPLFPFPPSTAPREELLDFEGTGMSAVMENSHRNVYEAVYQPGDRALRELPRHPERLRRAAASRRQADAVRAGSR